MIEYYNEEITFPEINTNKISAWIKHIIEKYNKELGDISYIFCSDGYLLEINKEYLNHHYNTDIITFNYNENELLNGDLFISLDTVRSNAREYDTTFEDELNRVMIHGILHLIGFDDKNDEEQVIMTRKENEALNILTT